MATAAFAPLTGAVDNGKSYNVEKVLRSNIVYSDYYRQLCKVTDFMTLVDEMYNEVTHVEPWMSGNARGPSTAFCILYRLFTLAPTRKLGDDGDDETQFLEDTQIKHLLDHGDSPYIRAIGFPVPPVRLPAQKAARAPRAVLSGWRKVRADGGSAKGNHDGRVREGSHPGPALLRDHLPPNSRGHQTHVGEGDRGTRA
jgi:hypothetical protein